jgi:putative glutamine amidotransferase
LIERIRRIAITQRVVENTTYPERRDCLSHDWARYINNTYPGWVPIAVPNTLDDPVRWYGEAGADALLLSNGNDVGTAKDRDRTERLLFDHAMSNRHAVLGVCRGLQAINQFLGGTGCDTSGSAVDHVASTHAVAILDSRFAEIAEATELPVNSFHEKAVDDSGLAQDLTAFAKSQDGLVEGLFHENLPVLAIQWHPERLSPSAEFDQALIRRLLTQGAFWNNPR